VAILVVFGVDAGKDAWCDVVASLVGMGPPRKRERAEREHAQTNAYGQIQHGRTRFPMFFRA